MNVERGFDAKRAQGSAGQLAPSTSSWEHTRNPASLLSLVPSNWKTDRYLQSRIETGPRDNDTTGHAPVQSLLRAPQG